MSDIHLSIHNGSINFNKINEIVKTIEKLGYKAELVDNGIIIFNVPEKNLVEK